MAAVTLVQPASTSTNSTLKRKSDSLMSSTAALLSMALVPLVALAAGAGLFAPYLYRDAPTWVAQARGQDVVTLLVGVPLLVVGHIGARRGSVRAFLLWLGSVGYIAYAYATYAFAAHFNSLFLVYVAAFGLAIYTLVFGSFASMRRALRAHFLRTRRRGLWAPR